MALVCVLHTLDECRVNTAEVKHFTEETWKNFQTAAKERLSKSNASISKYYPVCCILPKEIREDVGYHSLCYKNFTAVKKSEFPTIHGTKRLLRSDVQHPSTSRSGVFAKECIFCERVRKKVKGKEVSLGKCDYDSPENNVKAAAMALNDSKMLAKIGDIGFHEKEVHYHHECKREYLNKARAVSVNLTQNPRIQEDKSFQQLAMYIQSSVIDNDRPEFLVSLHRRYCSLVSSEEGRDVGMPMISVQYLGKKISEALGSKIMMDKRSKKEGVVVFRSQETKAHALLRAHNCTSHEETIVMEAARILRNVVLDLHKSSPQLSSTMNTEDFKNGQAQPPNILIQFFEGLYSNLKKEMSSTTSRRAWASSCDVMYGVTGGMLKSSKHLCLGMAMKSMTGSRKIVEILNRLGHCIDYHTIEEFETELAFDIASKTEETPDNIKKRDGLATGLAWDNYDEITETLSGSDTLHETVGICYQNECPDESGITEDKQEQDEPHNKRSRRRMFKPLEKQIDPYRQKPRLSTFNYEVYEVANPSNLPQVIKCDTLWMMAFSLLNEMPMWRGWNSKITKDPLPKQIVGYMENINLSPTRLDVVQETLKRSQQVAKECNETYAIVHYDLAIAKQALKIQDKEAPKFDNVFICFGPFHINMTYFACLGYLITSSGGPEILCNSGVLAQGSLNGFISGKHYNRCKRLHIVLATALQNLHFQRFIEENNIQVDVVCRQLKKITDEAADCKGDFEDDSLLNDLVKQYDEYSEGTRCGTYGATAQFWFSYIDLVQIYKLFDRACRTNDVNLFIYALGQMIPVFFAVHRPNYARWMVLYHQNLMNMDVTHPGARDTLSKGALSIRRTDKQFSRSPVDLTLEQTVNRDAASRHTGIAAFTDCIEARKRWTITRSRRGAIVRSLMDMVGLNNSTTEASQELKPSRVKRDNQDVSQVISSFTTSLNPFSRDKEDKKIFHITSGRAVSEDVANDLLNVVKKGTQWAKEFRQECQEDPSRFEKPISRRKVKNFNCDAITMKFCHKDRKMKEVLCTRDLFGRLLYVAAQQKLDLKEVLSYPLTIVPLSLAHIDGSMNKTDKSSLMRKLESKSIDHTQPVKADVYLIDFMYFLRTMTDLPATFGGIAKVILKYACTYGNIIHLICDTYSEEPSIKDFERANRGVDASVYSIQGRDQRRPADFRRALLSTSFKTSLINFLAEEWTALDYIEILEGNTAYFALEEVCYKYQVENNEIRRQPVEKLNCSHQEADTRIIFHAQFVTDTNTNSKIVVRSSDTDVFVLLIHFARTLYGNIWMDVGSSSMNTRRLINITNLSMVLGPQVCSALPAFHIFTGSDYTAGFMRKGKLRPYDLMVKNQQFLDAFSRIGCSDSVDQEVYSVIEKFVCSIYGQAKHHDVNVARFAMFTNMYAPKNIDQPLLKIKSSDPCCLPPCKSVLFQKVKRCNYVTKLYKNANIAIPTNSGPEKHGWVKDTNGQLKILWYDGPSYPLEFKPKALDDSDDEDDMICASYSDDEDDEDTTNE